MAAMSVKGASTVRTGCHVDFKYYGRVHAFRGDGTLASFGRSDRRGARAAVLGWSDDVGKPQDVLLTNANATVTCCHDKTRNLAEITRQADIVVAAIGRTAMVTRDFIKPGRSLLMLGLTKYPIPPRSSACSVKMNRVGRTFRNAVTSGWAMCTNDPCETWHRC